MKHRILALVAFGVLLGGGAMAACTSSDVSDVKDRVGTVEAQLGAGTDSGELRNLEIVTALNALAAAGLHALDESINTDNTVPAGAAGPIDRAVLAMAVVNWPDDLKSDADALQAKLQELSAAVGSDDAAAAGPVSSAAHEMSHEFSDAAASHVKASVGLETGGDHEEGTPTAGRTPDATAMDH